MLLAPRSWRYASTLRRLYTISATQPELPQIHNARFHVPKISTLCPEKLVPSDFLVLSGKKQPTFYIELPEEHERRKEATKLLYGSYANVLSTHIVSEVESAALRTPFPGHARGFLYLQLQRGSDLLRLASSIRFRCVPSLVEASSTYVASLEPTKRSTYSEPSVFLPPSFEDTKIYDAFKAGYDLTLPNGMLWSISVFLISGSPSLENIRMRLLEDKLFSESELQEYEKIYKNANTRVTRRSSLLYSLDDVFHIRFDTKKFVVWTMNTKDKDAKDKVVRGKKNVPASFSVFGSVFVDPRSKYGNKLPYIGAAHVRFELAPGSRLSRPTLCLRIVKITEPVKCIIPNYDGYLHMPKEGELVARGPLGKPELWRRHLNPSSREHSAILSLFRATTKKVNLH